jgi:hypothetical protein
VNLTGFALSYWRDIKIDNTYFLGCQFDAPEIPSLLATKEATILPEFAGTPFHVFRYRLYTSEELLQKLSNGVTLDQTIYCNYLSKGKFSPDIVEALCRRIHDDGIDDALEHLILEKGPMNFVAFMGGSSNKRTARSTRKLRLPLVF